MQGVNAYQCFYCFEIANFPGFLEIGENLTCTLLTRVIHLHTCPGLTEQAKTFWLKACLIDVESLFCTLNSISMLWIVVN